MTKREISSCFGNVFRKKPAIDPTLPVLNAFGTPIHMMRRNSDPDTSHEAAEKLTAGKLEALVYEVIARHPNGCTGDEVCRALPMHGVQTISPRYAPLIRKGYIEDTGERRKGSTSRLQRVLRVVKKDQ